MIWKFNEKENINEGEKNINIDNEKKEDFEILSNYSN